MSQSQPYKTAPALKVHFISYTNVSFFPRDAQLTSVTVMEQARCWKMKAAAGSWCVRYIYYILVA